MLVRAAKLALIITAVVILWFGFRGWPVEQAISPKDITVDQGSGYVVRLQPWVTSPLLLRIDVDSAARPEASRLRLTENTRLLGPAHSAHNDIRSLGRGRYSHWNETTALQFSTSDGSDPRTNERSYIASTAVRLPRSFALLAVCLLLAIVWTERRVLRRSCRPAQNAVRAVMHSAFIRAIVAVSIAALLLWALLVGVPLTQTIAPQRIEHDQGHTYYATMHAWRAPWPLLVKFDSSDAPEESTARVLENGQPFGSPHSIHDQIRTAGAGRFSHWGMNGQFTFQLPTIRIRGQMAGSTASVRSLGFHDGRCSSLSC